MINIYTERAAGKIGAADENKYKKIRGREMLSGLVINPKTLQGSANNGLSNIQNKHIDAERTQYAIGETKFCYRGFSQPVLNEVSLYNREKDEDNRTKLAKKTQKHA